MGALKLSYTFSFWFVVGLEKGEEGLVGKLVLELDRWGSWCWNLVGR